MKNLKNLGKVLSSKEQKKVNGGKRECELSTFQHACSSDNDCRAWQGAACYVSISGNGYCSCDNPITPIPTKGKETFAW